jgi:hypothetical protein
VQGAVRGDYPALLREFLLRRKSEISRRMGLIDPAHHQGE